MAINHSRAILDDSDVSVTIFVIDGFPCIKYQKVCRTSPEKPINNALVHLYTSSGEFIESQFTDISGGVTFNGLDKRDYRAEIKLPSSKNMLVLFSLNHLEGDYSRQVNIISGNNDDDDDQIVLKVYTKEGTENLSPGTVKIIASETDTGFLLPNISIRLQSNNTGTNREQITGYDGYTIFEKLLDGNYKIKAKNPSYFLHKNKFQIDQGRISLYSSSNTVDRLIIFLNLKRNSSIQFNRI